MKLELTTCGDATKWCADFDTPNAAWAACESPDWMFWLLRKTKADKKTIQTIACDIAELAVPYAGSNAQVCRDTIATVRAYLIGNATVDEVLAARRAILAARRAADATAYAADATAAAAYAATTYAADATAYAATDAYAAAAATAYARTEMKCACCSVIRNYIKHSPWEPK